MQHARSVIWMSWALRLIVAVILVQTLFFKFTAAKESVYIFSTLGMEPWGRVGSGVFELAASILLLIPSTITLGAAMAMAATGSAILFHLFRLGVALTGAIMANSVRWRSLSPPARQASCSCTVRNCPWLAERSAQPEIAEAGF